MAALAYPLHLVVVGYMLALREPYPHRVEPVWNANHGGGGGRKIWAEESVHGLSPPH